MQILISLGTIIIVVIDVNFNINLCVDIDANIIGSMDADTVIDFIFIFDCPIVLVTGFQQQHGYHCLGWVEAKAVHHPIDNRFPLMWHPIRTLAEKRDKKRDQTYIFEVKIKLPCTTSLNLTLFFP